MQRPLSYRHRVITDDDLIFIRKLIADHSDSSRWALSKKLCEAWNWVQTNGALRDVVCRGMMLMLHRQGLIELPCVRPTPSGLGKRRRPVLVNADEAPLRVSLAELGPLEVRQVRRTPEEAMFNSLLQQHHYLGYAQPVGEHLKYLVYAGGRPIACMAWSSAPRHLGSRDRFIGWSAQARLANIRLLAYNTRFLILPENVRGQMRHRHPGQDQESRVVGQQPDVLQSRLRPPADEPVAAAQVARRRAPCQAGHRPASGIHQILQMFTHRLRVAQVVVLLEQAVEQGLLGRTPYLAKLQRPEFGKRHLQWGLVHAHEHGLAALDNRIAHHAAHRRQLDHACAMKHQHQPATHHVAQCAVGLHPIPGLAQLLGQIPSARGGMCSDEVANEDDVVVGDNTVAVAQRSLHVSQRSRTGRGTQGLNANYLLRDNHEVSVSTGQTANRPKPASGRRGRTAQPFPVNLLRRPRDKADAVLNFTNDPAVPFTNNTGALTVRKLEVKQAVQRRSRAFEGAQNFATVRSYLLTLVKPGRNLFEAFGHDRNWASRQTPYPPE